MAAFDPTTVLSSSVDALTGAMSGVAPLAIGAAASIAALGIGWKLVRKYVKP